MRDDRGQNSLRRLSQILDSRYEFMGIKFGWDGIIGLIPGVGDVATSLLSFIIVTQAALMGCSTATLIRMTLNIALEAFVGIIPFVGDAFDIYWKANVRNMRLLDQHFSHPEKLERSSRLMLLMVFLCLLSIFVGTIFGAYWILRAIF